MDPPVSIPVSVKYSSETVRGMRGMRGMRDVRAMGRMRT
jgi:hypothetical protein